MTIEFEKSESGDAATLTIKGHFNFDVNTEFRKVLDSAAGPECKIIIDMSMVDEIDSSALGMLLLLREQCGGANEKIKIKKCRPDICDVLRMANFQSMFDIDNL